MDLKEIIQQINSLPLPIPGALKYDDGKAALYQGVLAYFPNALQAVANTSSFGAKKYAWDGWRHVPDGYARYTEALVRHITAEAGGEDVDPDSSLLHAQHTAWNALARLELLLTKDKSSNA